MTKEPGENPMQRLPDWRTTLPLAQSCPRCGAQTRAGTLCQSPAMQNGRCRMHGGASTGPRAVAGLARIRRARTVHGLYTAEMVELRRCCAEMRESAWRWKDEL